MAGGRRRRLASPGRVDVLQARVRRAGLEELGQVGGHLAEAAALPHERPGPEGEALAVAVLGEPRVAEHHATVVEAVPDDSTDGLVHGSRGLRACVYGVEKRGMRAGYICGHGLDSRIQHWWGWFSDRYYCSVRRAYGRCSGQGGRCCR